MAFLEMEILYVRIHPMPGLQARAALSDDGQNTTTVGFKHTVVRLLCAAVENTRAIDALQAADLVAVAAACRITGTGEDDADAPAFSEVDKLRLEFAFCCAEEITRKVTTHHRQHGLGFRITEAAVEF